MIGPVQLMMIGFKDSRTGGMPREIRAQIESLNDNPAVQLLDVLQVTKDSTGGVAERRLEGLMPKTSCEGVMNPGQAGSGEFIHALLTKGGAARLTHEASGSGAGFLYRKGPLPDIDALPANANVVVLLLNHRWASSFREAMRDSNAYPIDDTWMSHEALEAVGLAVGA